MEWCFGLSVRQTQTGYRANMIMSLTSLSLQIFSVFSMWCGVSVYIKLSQQMVCYYLISIGRESETIT